MEQIGVKKMECSDEAIRIALEIIAQYILGLPSDDRMRQQAKEDLIRDYFLPVSDKDPRLQNTSLRSQVFYIVGTLGQVIDSKLK